LFAAYGKASFRTLAFDIGLDTIQFGNLAVSERRICHVLDQHLSTQRRQTRGRADEDSLVADMIELTQQYGRYGYRRVAALLRDTGWRVNDKRVERLWKREGLKVPMK
jgi:hypothetical protein